MKSYDNDEETVQDIVKEWGAELCNKGYDIFNYDGTGLLEVEDIGDVDAYDCDEAVLQAIKDGILIIPIDQLPANMPEHMCFYGWIDTQENRENIERYCALYGD